MAELLNRVLSFCLAFCRFVAHTRNTSRLELLHSSGSFGPCAEALGATASQKRAIERDQGQCCKYIMYHPVGWNSTTKNGHCLKPCHASDVCFPKTGSPDMRGPSSDLRTLS